MYDNHVKYIYIHTAWLYII